MPRSRSQKSDSEPANKRSRTSIDSSAPTVNNNQSTLTSSQSNNQPSNSSSMNHSDSQSTDSPAIPQNNQQCLMLRYDFLVQLVISFLNDGDVMCRLLHVNKWIRKVHHSVDPNTGDVWSADVCEEYKTQPLRKLQQTIRKRIGLTDGEYKTLRKPGPMCPDRLAEPSTSSDNASK